MACLGKLDAVFHRLAITDLTDKYDVGCLTQRVFQGCVPGFSIDSHFALGNHTTLVWMHVLHRILNGNDVASRIMVAMSDHRCKCCRLTGARTANNDTKAAFVHNNVFENRRQFEILERWNLCRNRSQDRADVTLLNECAYAKTPDALWCDGEVTFFGCVKFLDLSVIHDRANHDRRLISRKRRICRFMNRAVDFDCWRKPLREEQVRAVTLDHFSEQILR